jgi:hypothetical protein
MVDNLKCDFCQRTKLDGKGYGFLPKREVQSLLFEECTVDLIELWNIQVCGKPHKFEAVDVPIQELKSRTQVKNPRQDSKPKTQVITVVFCLFVGLFASFTQIPGWRMTPKKCHIRDVCTIAKNPQDMASAKEYIDEALSIAMHAMKAAIHSTLGSSPESLKFNWDMFLNIPLIAYWHKNKHI